MTAYVVSDDYYRRIGHMYLKQAQRHYAGLTEMDPLRVLPPVDVLRTSEWSPEFEERVRLWVGLIACAETEKDSTEVEERLIYFFQLMRNRLIMGAFRYGLLGNPDGTKPKWDKMTRLSLEWDKYNACNNLESLLDIANMALLEYVEGSSLHDKVMLVQQAATAFYCFDRCLDRGLVLQATDDGIHNNEVTK